MQYFHIPFPLISLDLTAEFSQGPVPHDTVFGVTPFQKNLCSFPQHFNQDFNVFPSYNHLNSFSMNISEIWKCTSPFYLWN